MKIGANDVIRMTITIVLLIAMWKGNLFALYLLLTFVTLSGELLGWILRYQQYVISSTNLKSGSAINGTLKE